MLYVFCEQDYDSVDYKATFRGPKVDIHKLRDEWNSNFDERTLGSRNYPEYPQKSSKSKEKEVCIFNTGELFCSSGSISVGSLPNIKSPKYKKWLKAHEKITRDYNKKRDEKIVKFRRKYSGQTIDEMFISYLKKEYKFKEIGNVEMVFN